MNAAAVTQTDDYRLNSAIGIALLIVGLPFVLAAIVITSVFIGVTVCFWIVEDLWRGTK